MMLNFLQDKNAVSQASRKNFPNVSVTVARASFLADRQLNTSRSGKTLPPHRSHPCASVQRRAHLPTKQYAPGWPIQPGLPFQGCFVP